jgi:serine protease Do
MKKFVLLVAVLVLTAMSVSANDLVHTIKTVKNGVVAIGLHTPLESSAPSIRGTGFVFGNGRYIATNYHVVAQTLDPSIVQNYVALAGEGRAPVMHKLSIVAIQPVHDLAILQLETPLAPLPLSEDAFLPEGSMVALTGFPIGSVLGLYPATHQAMIAAITPDAIPLHNTQGLSQRLIDKLQAPSMVYQLDGTAYPGNSGSPLYSPVTGEVVGIINKVIVSEGKESAISTPTGISYAIPVKYLRELAQKHNIQV